MDIVFLSPHSDPQAKLGEPDSGGQCVYEHELASALSKIENVQVTVFCRHKFEHPTTTQVNPCYTIRRIKCGGEQFVRKEDMEAVLPEFVDQILENYPLTEDTLVHAHYWDGAKAALMLKFRSGLNFPLIWTPHSLGIAKRNTFHTKADEKRFNLISRIMWENYAVLLADSLHVSSAGERQQLLEHYHADPDIIRVIPPGVNSSVFDRVEQQKSRQFLDLPETEFLIVTAGRLTPEKGFHHAIHALALIAPSLRKSLKLVIIGGASSTLSTSESDYLASLKQLAHDLDLQDSVLFRRSVDYTQMSYVYCAGDIFLCLSEYEPFGLTIIESMYIGTPVIATNNGGPVDIITHDYDGYLVDRREYGAVARHIEHLIQNPDKAHQLIKHAKETVEKRFNWHIIAQNCIANYETQLHQRTSFALDFMRGLAFLRHNL